MANGSIRQRSSGSWELRVDAGISPDTGRRRYRTATVLDRYLRPRVRHIGVGELTTAAVDRC